MIVPNSSKKTSSIMQFAPVMTSPKLPIKEEMAPEAFERVADTVCMLSLRWISESLSGAAK